MPENGAGDRSCPHPARGQFSICTTNSYPHLSAQQAHTRTYLNDLEKYFDME
jgi:hypothetical protein